MKKKTLLFMFAAYLISAVSMAQTAYPFFPYWNAGTQEAWTVPTDKTTDNEPDFVGTVNADWSQSAAFFDQANNGGMPTMANDTAAKLFITGANEKTFSIANHPRKVTEAADFNSGAAWKGSLSVFDTRTSKAFYSVNFTEPGKYSLYLRIRGDVGSKYAAKLTQAADYTGVNWMKDWGTIDLAGLTASSNVGDKSTDNKAEYVGLGLGKADGTIGETSYNRNSVYWFKAINDEEGYVTIPAAGVYVLYVDHVAGGSFTGFGGFTFLKKSEYIAPDVTLINPENNQNHKAGVEITLSASTKANSDYTITGLEFFEGANSLGAATSAGENLWNLNWTPTEGIYNITAVATDSKDSLTASKIAVLNVANIPDDVWADTIPNDSLIISEVMLGWHERVGMAYVEFTNMSSKTIDLSQYYVHNPNGNTWGSNQSGYEGRLKKRLSGLLAPGESYLYTRREVSGALDGYGNKIYPDGWHNIEIERQSDMPIIQYYSGVNGCFTAAYNVALTYVQLNGDSALVDVFGPAKYDPETTNNKPNSTDKSEILLAGKSGNDVVREWVYVRKFDVKSGNTSFIAQAGTDETDSEWIPLPRNQVHQFDKAFTTVGSHGGSKELILSSNIATIDKNAMTITLPYGISRDSVFRKFEIGPNTAWDLQMGADTSQFFVQTGDTLHFFVAGTGVKSTYTFGVTVLAQTDDFAQVRPAIYRNPSNFKAWVKRYSISDGTAPKDTIGNIPFHESIDTFIKYMEIEEGGATTEGLTWNYIPLSGMESPEIENGDILEVTAKNGSKKQYKLVTNDYFPNHDADLKLVIIPGMEFENPETYLFTDTMLTFTPNKLEYVLDLPMGTKISPAIIAKASSLKANVEVMRAKDLNGSAENKTATIKVTAEDDTTIKEYKILFKVERETPTVKGTLFISNMARGWGRYYKDNHQLFNPTDEMIDLTEYAIIFLSGSNQYGSLLNNTAIGQGFMNQNGYIIRPGYKVMEKPEGVVFETDLVQEKVILDPKEVYAIADFQAFPMQNGGLGKFPSVMEGWGYKLDLWIQGNSTLASGRSWWDKYVELTGFPADPYGVDGLLGKGFMYDPRLGNSFLLTKIVNDSIKDGLKSVATSYEQVKADYEIVDVFNGETGDADWTTYDNDTLLAWGPLAANRTSYSFTRKPEIYKGNPIDKLSFGLGDSSKTSIPSEWDVIATGGSRASVRSDAWVKFGEHLFLSNAHISYLSSSKYIMGEGLEGPQDVFGVEAGTKGDQFLTYLIKADAGMTIKVLNPDDSEKELDTDMKAGDKIWSYSANGYDSVLYVISEIGPLSDDCSLASSTYDVSKDGATGIISGIEMGTSIKDILATLTPAANSNMVQTNGGEVIIPLEQYNNDTILIQSEDKIDVVASEMVYIEVTAQNKTTKCLYALEFNEVEMPYILSNVYKVDEDNKVIDFVTPVTPEKFLSYLIASPGATMRVVNKAYQDRTSAIMKYDDRVVVTKGDQSVIYLIKYTAEPTDGLAGIDIDLAVEKHAQATLSAYPNPTTDYVSLTGFKAISKITVRDITGRMIKTSTADNNSPKVDMRSYPSGIYFIKVMSSVGETTFKVIKE